MKVVAIENVRGVGGTGIAITVVCRTMFGHETRQAFKTDGSATNWQWLEDGSPCPHAVGQAWEAYKARNILAGKPAYTCSNFETVKPGLIGVDLASGPSKSVWYCGECGINDYPCNHAKDQAANRGTK